MSRSVCRSSSETRSTDPMVPPASPIAPATLPSMPGWCAMRTRRTKEYCAESVAMAADPGLVAELGQALGLGLALGLALLALLLLALAARVIDVHDPHRGAEGAIAAVGFEVLAAAPAAAAVLVAAATTVAAVATAAALTAAAATPAPGA